jgi:hypothetical protein
MIGPVEMIIVNNNLPLLQQLDPLMKKALMKALNEIGEECKTRAVQAIQNQIAPDNSVWTPLQQWWVAWKKAKGYSEQIYIMTSSYLQAITSQVSEDADDLTAIIGVMRSSGFALDGTTPVWKIAEILEYGWEEFSVTIPPRPLWRPLNQVMKHKAQTKVGVAIFWAVKKIQAQAKGSVTP